MQNEDEVGMEVEDIAETVEEVDPEEGIRIAFDGAVSEESEEDEVKLQMIAAGATFKNVTRLYNKYMIDSGLAISKSDRNQIVEDALEGGDFESEEGFTQGIADLVFQVKGATDRSAAALIRSYTKKNDLPCYSKPKGEGVARTSFAGLYYDFLAGNPSMTEKEAADYIDGEGDHADTSANVKKHQSHYIGIWSLVNRIVSA